MQVLPSQTNKDSTEQYDRWHRDMSKKGRFSDPLSLPWYESVYNNIGDIQNGSLLEVGCGRGEFSLWLKHNRPNLQITALDFSPSAIGIASKEAAESGSILDYRVGDAQALPFADQSFDYYISCECLEHVERPQEMINEIFRVLRPGGRFFLTTENYLNGMSLAWLKSWLTNAPFDSGSGVQPRENYFLFPMVTRFFRKAGLKIDRMESSHFQWLLLPRTDPSRLCTYSFKNPILNRIFLPFGRHFSLFGSKPLI